MSKAAEILVRVTRINETRPEIWKSEKHPMLKVEHHPTTAMDSGGLVLHTSAGHVGMSYSEAKELHAHLTKAFGPPK